jgi:hypothetical protein
MTRLAVREPALHFSGLALGALCLVGACRPDDANLGGTWVCPSAQHASCFYFDNALQPQSTDGGVQQITNDAVLALFNVAQDPDPAKAPRIAYPLDQTTEPTNLYDLDVQWHRPLIEQTLFRIRVESPKLPYGRYEIYTQCLPSHDGCHYSVPGSPPDNPLDNVWQTNVLVPLSGSDAELTVAASDGKGGPISVSLPVHLHFSEEPIQAGLYYWSAHAPNAPPGSPDQGTTYRLALGARTAAPFIRPGVENPDQCEGCHAVSRNGDVIAFTATDSLVGPQSGSFFVKTTTDPTDNLFTPGTNDSAMIALNGDGSLAIVGMDNTTVDPPQHGALYLRRLVADAPPGLGTPIPTEFLGDEKQGYFPDLSPDGKRLVVTLSAYPDSPWAVRTGSIATLDFDQTTDTFSPAKVLVPMTDTDFHYYPSWSPDNNWIVFVSAPRGGDPSSCYDASGATCVENSFACVCPPNSYDQPNSRLRLAHFPDGRVYDLDRATQGVGLTSTLPKFAPTNNGHEFFITFNSKMPYGIEVPDNIPAQLWLSVVDIDRLPDDPSSAPVWLPFQSFGQKNHLAYWTEKVPCRTDLDLEQDCGPDEYCFVPKVDAGPTPPGECLPNTVVK